MNYTHPHIVRCSRGPPDHTVTWAGLVGCPTIRQVGPGTHSRGRAGQTANDRKKYEREVYKDWMTPSSRLSALLFSHQTAQHQPTNDAVSQTKSTYMQRCGWTASNLTSGRLDRSGGHLVAPSIEATHPPALKWLQWNAPSTSDLHQPARAHARCANG